MRRNFVPARAPLTWRARLFLVMVVLSLPVLFAVAVALN